MADNFLTKHVCPCGKFAIPQLMSSKGRECYGSFSPDDIDRALHDMPRVLTDLISEYAAGCRITRLVPCFQCKRFAGIEGINHCNGFALSFENIRCDECRQGLRNQCGINTFPNNYSYDLYTRRGGACCVSSD